MIIEQKRQGQFEWLSHGTRHLGLHLCNCARNPIHRNFVSPGPREKPQRYRRRKKRLPGGRETKENAALIPRFRRWVHTFYHPSPSLKSSLIFSVPFVTYTFAINLPPFTKHPQDFTLNASILYGLQKD